MVLAGIKSAGVSSFEEHLRANLAMSQLAMESSTPLLRKLIASSDLSLFSDEIVARVRGMIGHVAEQLVGSLTSEPASTSSQTATNDRLANALVSALAADDGLLRHVHALAIEWQLTERLQGQAGLDGALTPLLQKQIASGDAPAAETAMAALAAQVRFLQNARRMELPLGELPSDQFHAVLQALHTNTNETAPDAVDAALARLRGSYVEGRSRLALIGRVVSGLSETPTVALEVETAGVAVFLSALAFGSGQLRDTAVFSTTPGQFARLVAAVRAAGLDRERAAKLFAFLHPEQSLPETFEALPPESAAELLLSADAPGEL